MVSPVAGLPDDKAPTAETPDVSLAFADLPGSPEFSMPTLPSPGFPDFGAPHLPIPTLAGLAILPTADELAALPDLSGALAGEPGLANLSTMAQLAAPLSQLSGLSGAAGGLSQLTNIAGQQAQMISSLAQQGAQQHAALADQVRKDDHNDGAAAGTTTTEPAPVDAATGSAPQPGTTSGKAPVQPSPAKIGVGATLESNWRVPGDGVGLFQSSVAPVGA
ncbi:hypothetical protein I547_6507 [Mycobacterium kansasii 824]|nr:hypothetical protein I547_6507 [Mycobacterium kansasii 824]